ncbi:MAG: VWA domain-containing protein [Verrucomicrobiales bacterium]
MDWESPYLLLLIVPALALLFWFDARTSHPMSEGRRRALLLVRALLVVLAAVALANPAYVIKSDEQAAIFVIDHSQSEGESGIRAAYAAAEKLRGDAGGAPVGYVAAGSASTVLAEPAEDAPVPEPRLDLMQSAGAQTNLADAAALAQGLFPAGAARHLILLSDGQQTRGDLEKAAREAAAAGMKIHAVAIPGEARPDVRVAKVASSQPRINEGASVELTASIESSLAGKGVVKLYENGLEVDRREIEVAVGEDKLEVFRRAPDKRNIYNYRVALEGFAGDAIPENNEALTIVDVRGKPLLLYIEGDEGESRYLSEAMAREGIRLQVRGANGVPQNLADLAGYDGIILSDVPAHEVGEGAMASIRDYVEKLGGGFVMIGGMNSFGVGGYYRTPIEDVLPVKLKAPDQEEQMSAALALVLDRSGSMSGQKIELCKSAAIATAELLSRKDYIGVFAFDSQLHIVAPMQKVASVAAIRGQIAGLTSGGGTNIMPGMTHARAELGKVKAKIKHMIVLTDGQTSGNGYEALAAQCRTEGITISTVAIGQGSQVGLLQRIANAGGGQAYTTADPAALTRIFTQDTMVHTGKMIREEAFQPQQVERHPMLKNWGTFESPPLLGYVKTNRKSTAQIPLVTDLGDPLLAHWRYGLGKVTAFTSDCKSRWASLWVANWPGYSQLWAQVLRETARAPQGQNMDLRTEEDGDEVRLFVDVLEDAGSFRNDAQVEADIYFVPANALGSSMRLIETRRLGQAGPGSYAERLPPRRTRRLHGARPRRCPDDLRRRRPQPERRGRHRPRQRIAAPPRRRTHRRQLPRKRRRRAQARRPGRQPPRRPLALRHRRPLRPLLRRHGDPPLGARPRHRRSVRAGSRAGVGREKAALGLIGDLSAEGLLRFVWRRSILRPYEPPPIHPHRRRRHIRHRLCPHAAGARSR